MGEGGGVQVTQIKIYWVSVYDKINHLGPTKISPPSISAGACLTIGNNKYSLISTLHMMYYLTSILGYTKAL